MAINRMMLRKAAKVENITLKVFLNKVVVTESEAGPHTSLEFYSATTKGVYERTYSTGESRDRVNFTRTMQRLGCNRNNFQAWFNIMISEQVEVEITVDGKGEIRFIKKLDESKIEMITKRMFLNTIEGIDNLDQEDINLMMSLPLAELKEDFGQ